MVVKKKIDRSELSLAEHNNKALEEFVDEIKSVNNQGDNPSVEAERIVMVLEWFLDRGRDHYRNLLHCFSIAEKKGTNQDFN